LCNSALCAGVMPDLSPFHCWSVSSSLRLIPVSLLVSSALTCAHVLSVPGFRASSCLFPVSLLGNSRFFLPFPVSLLGIPWAIHGVITSQNKPESRLEPSRERQRNPLQKGPFHKERRNVKSSSFPTKTVNFTTYETPLLAA